MKAERQRRAPDLSRAALEGVALRYLERFDCSVARLKRVLQARVDKALRAGVESAGEASAIIEQILERYRASGLLDDRRFAQNFAERQRERGASRRRIEQKLRARGVSSDAVNQALLSPGGGDGPAELLAAQAFARRRRLGPHRKPEAREAYRQKDLQALARAGFDYDTATRVIGASRSSSDDVDF